MTLSDNEVQFMLGHRGFRGSIANTLPAFRRALKYADGIELDVRITADERLVLLHDGEFRVNGLNYRVENLDHLELRKLHPIGKLVTTLREAVRLNPRVLNVDVKDIRAFYPSLRLIERRGLIERTVFSSDRVDWVGFMRRECPYCKVGFSITAPENAFRSITTEVYSIHVPLDVVRYIGVHGARTLLRLYRRRGLKVWLWNYTMDELGMLPRFLSMADAVISDDPAKLKRFLFHSQS